MTIAKETAELLAKLGVAKEALSGGDLVVRSPVTGEQLAALKQISAADAGKAIDAAHEAFKAWRLVPGPKGGELVRLLGEELRAHKAELGRLVSIEVGKIADIKTLAGKGGSLEKAPFKPLIEDFYLTNTIARASAVMAECSRLASGQMLTAAE